VPKRDGFIKCSNQLKGMFADTLFVKGIRILRDLQILSNELNMKKYFHRSLIQGL
jgi:hypothetical protein